MKSAVTSEAIASSFAFTRCGRAGLTAALAITAMSAATLAGAWFFQLVLDIRPCPLCLEQRYAYYLVVPLGCWCSACGCEERGTPLTGRRLRHHRGSQYFGMPAGDLSFGRRMGLLARADRMHGPVGNFGNAGSLLQRLDT